MLSLGLGLEPCGLVNITGNYSCFVQASLVFRCIFAVCGELKLCVCIASKIRNLLGLQ